MNETASYSVNLSFEAIKLPPVTDILVLGKKHAQGKKGIMESFRFTAPDEFELFDLDNDEGDYEVEAILVNKRILKRLPVSEIISVLKKSVFPYVSKGEAVKVDFSVKINVENIKGSIEF